MRFKDVTPRLATPEDADALAQLRHALWPDGPVEEHASELAPILRGTSPSTLPYAIFVAEDDGRIIGFAEVGLRSHAEDCDPRQPVGFLEGWFVVEDRRRQGVGAALVAAAEQWSRDQGCIEMASDTWHDAEVSQRAHQALGYEIVARNVHFRKKL